MGSNRHGLRLKLTQPLGNHTRHSHKQLDVLDLQTRIPMHNVAQRLRREVVQQGVDPPSQRLEERRIEALHSRVAVDQLRDRNGVELLDIARDNALADGLKEGGMEPIEPRICVDNDAQRLGWELGQPLKQPLGHPVEEGLLPDARLANRIGHHHVGQRMVARLSISITTGSPLHCEALLRPLHCRHPEALLAIAHPRKSVHEVGQRPGTELLQP
mmetsp:Transcript_7213/g.20813  ORF Transcript_7213/g.20813 Transcript_7213/m.20813 type:complete len:215 (+) Transcript_7213:968-1612(+)